MEPGRVERESADSMESMQPLRQHCSHLRTRVIAQRLIFSNRRRSCVVTMAQLAPRACVSKQKASGLGVAGCLLCLARGTLDTAVPLIRQHQLPRASRAT